MDIDIGYKHRYISIYLTSLILTQHLKNLYLILTQQGVLIIIFILVNKKNNMQRLCTPGVQSCN